MVQLGGLGALSHIRSGQAETPEGRTRQLGSKKTPIPMGNGGPEVEVGTAKCDASLRVAWLQVLLHSAAWLFLDRNRFWILDFGERAFDKSASLFAFDDEVDRPSAQLVIWRVHE